MGYSNETVAILSIMSQIDKKSMEQALKDANKSMQDVEIGFDGQKFKKKLIEEYNEAIEEIYRLSPKINLSKLQRNALVNIVNSKDAESANNALEEYVNNIKILLDLTTGNKDNRTIFDNISPKNLDKIIEKWGILAKKRRDYESVGSDKDENKHLEKAENAKKEAKSLTQLLNLYEKEDKYKKGREESTSDKYLSVLKTQLDINKKISSEQEGIIKDYSKYLDMYFQMSKSKPKYGTTDYIKWGKEMQNISEAILTSESKIKEFSNKPDGFRGFLSETEEYSSVFKDFTEKHTNNVTAAISGYFDTIKRSIKLEIDEMNTNFLQDLLTYKESDSSFASKDINRLKTFYLKRRRRGDDEVESGLSGGYGNGSGSGFSEENAELKKYIVNADEAKNKILELVKTIDKNKSKLLGAIPLEKRDLEIAKDIFGYMQRLVDLNPDKTVAELFNPKNGFSQKDLPGELVRKFGGQNLGSYANEIEDFKNLIHSFSVDTPSSGGDGSGFFKASTEDAQYLLDILEDIADILEQISKDLSDGNTKGLSEELTKTEDEIKQSLSGIIEKFKEDLSETYSSFSEKIKTLDDVEWDFDNLRNNLLGIVDEFKASLAAAGLEIKYANNVYEMLKGWNDADKAMNGHLGKNNTVRERGAYFHSKTGKVSNSFFYDEKDEFSAELRDSIKKLALNANEKVSDIFDTAIHSHPIHDVTVDNLYKTIGSNIAFSYSDLEAGINRVLKEHIANAMVTSGDRYTNLNLAGITEAQKDAFLKAYMDAALKSGAEKTEGGTKVSNFLVDDKNNKGKKLFDYDKLTAAVNDAIYAGLDAIGFDRSRLTTGHISDFNQNSDISSVESTYQDNFAQLVSIAERILAVLNDINSNGFRFASSEDTGNIDITLSPDSKSFEAKAAESLEMMFLDKNVELKPDASEFEKDSNTVLTFIELDKNVELKPDVDTFETGSNLKLDEIKLQKKVELIPDEDLSRFTDSLEDDIEIFDTESTYTFFNKTTGEVLELKELIDNITGEIIHVTELLDNFGNIDASNYPNGLIDADDRHVYYPEYLSKFSLEKTGSEDIFNKIDSKLTSIVNEFVTLLREADSYTDWDFSNLRNELLGVVKKYRDALAEVGIDAKPLNEVYMMLKGWSDADIGISNARSVYEDHSERAAYANLKTGKISNPYFYDNPGSVRGEIFDEIEKLLPIEEIGDMFDTSIHSHNIRKFADTLGQPGMPTVGADIAFSPSDIISAISDAVHRNIPKSLVVNQGRYSLLDLSDLTNIESFFERFEKGELLQEAYLSIASKMDLPSYVNDNDEYDFNLLTNDVNKGIADALEKVGFDRNLIKSGELSELNIEIPEEPRESNFTKLVSVVEKILSAVEYIKVNGLKTSIDDQPSTTIDKDKASKNPYKDLVSKDFTTNNEEESLNQLAEAYKTMEPFYWDYEARSTEDGRKAAYAYVQSWYDAWSKGIINNQKTQQYLFDDYNNNSPLYGAFNIEEDETFKHIVNVVEELSKAYDIFYDNLGDIDINDKPELEEFNNYINNIVDHVRWLNDAQGELLIQTTDGNRDYYARLIEEQEYMISDNHDYIKNLAISMREKYSFSTPDSNEGLIASSDTTKVQVQPTFIAEDFIKEIETILKEFFAKVGVKPQLDDPYEFILDIEQQLANETPVKVNVVPLIDSVELFISKIESLLEGNSAKIRIDPNVDVKDFIEKTNNELNSSAESSTTNYQDLENLLTNLKDVCTDLYVLKDDGSILDAFKVSKGNISNIENLAYAVDLLRETLSKFDNDARDALDSLALLSNQSEKLKDLYNVLKEANKASAETKKKIAEETANKKNKDSIEDIDELGEAYKNVTRSISDFIELANLKMSGFELNSEQLERYETLKTRILNAKNGVDAYASAVEGANGHQKKFNENLEKAYSDQGTKYIEFLQDKLSNISSKQGKTPAYADYIKNIDADITRLSAKLPLDFTDESSLKDFYDEFIKIQKAMDNYNSKEFVLAKPLEIQNMTASFETWVANNSAALKQFGGRIEEIRRSLGNIVSEADKDKVKMAIAELRAEVNKTGAAGRSMFDMWKQRAKNFMAYLGTYVGFYDILQKLREGFDIAVTYDTQLTEMKKVSDETMASLKEFQKASFALGDSVGTTGQQVQASTADFMRLGESLDKAAQSALDANTLFKVSEFETIEEATEALISMSQAFQELEKSEINDIANHIGKELPKHVVIHGDYISQQTTISVKI